MEENRIAPERRKCTRKPAECDSRSCRPKPIAADAAMRVLEATVLAGAHNTIVQAVKHYNNFLNALIQSRQVFAWANADNDVVDLGMSFNQACSDNGRNPEEIRSRLFCKVPAPLMTLLKEPPYESCPFCQR